MNMISTRPMLARSALLVSLLLALGGCSWLRGNSEYEKSPESRSLEVPPELDTPRVDPSMSIPSPSSAAPVAPAATSSATAAFTIADSADGAWRRLGLALERTEGVTVTQKAQALSAYNVSYAGQEFLVRVVAVGSQSRVEAVDASGALLSSGPAAELLGLLRARLG